MVIGSHASSKCIHSSAVAWRIVRASRTNRQSAVKRLSSAANSQTACARLLLVGRRALLLRCRGPPKRNASNAMAALTATTLITTIKSARTHAFNISSNNKHVNWTTTTIKSNHINMTAVKKRAANTTGSRTNERCQAKRTTWKRSLRCYILLLLCVR